MAVSGVFFRPNPCFSGGRIDTHSDLSSNSSFSGVSINGGLMGFNHIQYYNMRKSSSAIKCGGGKKEKKKGFSGMGAVKKMKFLKGLSMDLSMISHSSENGGVGESKKKMISEVADIMLEQLQQLRTEEKELKKKKKKKEKSKLKTAARRMQNKLAISSDSSSDSSESSSDSSSDSSDSDCKEVVHRRHFKTPILNELRPLKHEATSTLPDTQTLERDTIEVQPVEVSDSRNIHDQEECCTGTSTSYGFSNGSGRSRQAASKKIEVCMGGKCRNSGAAALLEKFEKVLGGGGGGGDVGGCKCMGKCRTAPNVRISDRASTKVMCTGVGVEDVDSILAKV